MPPPAVLALEAPTGSHHIALHSKVMMAASAHSWHAMQVSIVSQEPILFAESIMHNIAYGTPGGSASVSLAMVRPWPALVSLLCVHCHIHCCNNGIRTACANELSCALTSELLGNLC